LISSHILSELTNLVTYYGFIDQGRMVRQLSSEELAQESKQYIELKVDKVEEMTALLETRLGCTSYKVTPELTIHIYDYLDQPSKISEMAVRNGIALNAITIKDINLENYFIQLVGGKSND
jgi:ABC-2 type transport system ATP-binding protein